VSGEIRGGSPVWDVESGGTACVLVADCQWPQSRACLKPETMRVTFEEFSPTHDFFDYRREDYAARKIPTRAFAANALYPEVVRLAYNLVTAFQRTCLPEDWQSLTLSKLRQRLLWLPGELTRPQNRPILRLVNSSLIAQKAEKILRRVHRLKPLDG
jgi:hypothetical protein